MEKKICWDADETLIGTTPAFDSYLNHKYGKNIKYEDHITFDLQKLLGMPEKQIKEAERLFYETHFYRQIKAKEGAFEVVDDLYKTHTQIVITGRSGSDEKHLHWTLAQLFEPHHFSDIHHMGGDEGYSMKKQKWEKCKEEGITLIIDDYHETLIRAAIEGIYGIIVTAPWNRNENDLPKLITRARNLYEAREIIEKKDKIFWPS